MREPPLDAPIAAGILLAAGIALVALRPRHGAMAGAATWLGLVAAIGATSGMVAGAARLAAIDAGAFEGPDGRPATARGFVTAVPRRADGTVSVRVQTDAGRLLIEAEEPVGELPVGREVEATGTLREPAEWERAYLRRHGIGEVLAADRLRARPRRRGGVAALVDVVRGRAEGALERGMPESEAALARGFVLGQDDRIDAATVDDFKRSGLAHLLAVSGQNVILLALLAMPLLALLDLSLRARLLWVLALIALYVPVTGAGPSIQRAGVMGAAGIVAGVAGRPRSRWYALLLAAAATLALNPLASGDVGWQLSFAAVIGILLWARGIAAWLLARLGDARRARPSSWQVALAEGAAMTIAAALATAPLMAHHFDSFSVTTLPANLLALPAVAPVMWLGMLAAMAGQVPALPVEPLNGVNALLIAYITQIAHWMASPDWALARVRLSAPALAGAYAAMLSAGWVLGAAATRRLGLRWRSRRAGALALLAVVAVGLHLAVPASGGEDGREAAAELEITVLDVGQGDATLLEPPDGDPVLVDAGPPGAGIAAKLAGEGVDRLAAVAVTHAQLDHAGGLDEVLAELPVGSLAHATASRPVLAGARAADATPVAVARGDTLRSGSLRLDVLWPPPLPRAGAEDPNASSLVLVARWRRFSMLLTGDAEAEAAPIEPGPVDVLKVAHHGSEDAGLERLLDVTVPRAAVISVGDDNPYGHPAAATLSALAANGATTLRTDEIGDVEIAVDRESWSAGPG
ncbi:MAG TPA: ComEC/Rec2 family competence protein [Solirubrobacterales bacterium]|nr:ComEC/Rec2 family competence protein [Solirubrobacterales bacterium]